MRTHRYLPPKYAGWLLTMAMIVSAGGACTEAQADPPATPQVTFAQQVAAASIKAPLRVGKDARALLTGPVWTGPSLQLEMPNYSRTLAQIEYAGKPCFDPSDGHWYASANGSLVRVQGNSLIVVGDNVQGIDVDVRSKASVAVSREPNDTIVLHRFGNGSNGKKVLLSGENYFNPRLSPSGDRVLVSESTPTQSRIWLVALDSGTAKHIGNGVNPSWHPDGENIVFVRLQHDGEVVMSSELWVMNLPTMKERSAGVVGVSALHPEVSRDGKMVAFIDSRTSDAFAAPFQNPFTTMKGN